MNRNRKWKYVGKAVLSGVLVTSLLVGNIGYAEAKPISQEETVYVELAEDVTKEEKADKETKLPVDVKITYLLDGKEIAGKDLVGKSGKLTIRVKYTNRSTRKKSINGKSETLYTPFIMATMMVLPSDKFTNVEAKDAKVMESASRAWQRVLIWKMAISRTS